LDRHHHFLDAAFNNQIRDVLVDGDDIYVCGSFTAMGNTPVSRVVRWNGSAWSDMGITLTHTFGQPSVACLAKYQQWIVAAGRFVTVNGQPGNIALWDGVSWSATTIAPNPFESNASVSALLSADGYLYVGGSTAYLSTPGCVWRWDGVSAAQPLSSTGFGSGNDYISALLSWNGELYAGGYFHRIDGITVQNAARFDGSTWHAMGTGLPPTGTGIPYIVSSLVVHNDALYSVGCGHAWYWTGTTWAQPLPAAPPCEFSCGGEGFRFLDRLYMAGPTGGYKGMAMTDASNSIWLGLKDGLSPTPCTATQLAEYQGKLLVAGSFTAAGGLPAPVGVGASGARAPGQPRDRHGGYGDGRVRSGSVRKRVRNTPASCRPVGWQYVARARVGHRRHGKHGAHDRKRCLRRRPVHGRGRKRRSQSREVGWVHVVTGRTPARWTRLRSRPTGPTSTSAAIL
jgi:hypothetical protein